MSQETQQTEQTNNPVDISIDSLLGPQPFVANANQQQQQNPNPAPESTGDDANKNKDDKSGQQQQQQSTDTEDNKSTDQKTFNTEDNKAKVKTFVTGLNAEQLSDENKAIKQDLLESYKGAAFDAEGNIVDKDGKVVAKFDDVFTDLVTEPEVSLDADGNQIDEDGKIIKTKAQLAAETDGDLINNAHSQLEYEFVDDKGQTKVYSNDVEGVKEFVKDYSNELSKKAVEELLSSYPIVEDLVQHLRLGGKFEDFKQTVDYSKVDKTKLSSEEKLKTIRRSLEIKNLESNRVDNYLSLVKDSNTVDKEYDDAVKVLNEHNKATKEAQNKAIADMEAAEAKRVQDHWNNVNQHIKENKVSFVNIPDSEKDAFYKYMSTSVDEKGNSQELLDMMNDSISNRLGLAYLRFKKFNFDSIIKQKTRESRVTNLRSSIAKSINLKAENNASATDNTRAPQKEITIDMLLSR